MADTDQFDTFCRTILRPRLENLERRRRILMLLALVLVALLASAGLVLGLAPSGRTAWSAAFPWLLLGAAPVAIVFFFKFSSFRRDFKGAIIERLIRFINPGFDYQADGYVEQSAFEAGRMFTQEVHRYTGEDCVAGTIDRTAFKFSEIHAEHETEGEKGKRSTKTIFKGLYFVADFNKHFRSHTVVLPDTAERVFGFLGKALQSMNPNRASLVKLEDPEFEPEFVVYGEDQIEARYILSPSLMQRMLGLKRRVGRGVYFAFARSQVHVAIATRRDYFEPRLFSSALALGAVAQYYQDVLQIIAIVEELNLNTRIWSKT